MDADDRTSQADDGLPLRVVQRAPNGTAPSRQTRRGRGIAFGLTALSLTLIVVIWLNHPTPDIAAPRLASGNAVSQASPGIVLGLGKLLPRGRILTIAPPFGAGDARIAELLVQEGETVRQGSILAVLDSAPSLRAALAVAEASVGAREAALAQTILTVTAGRDDARGALARAESAVRSTRRDLDRAATLSTSGDITDQILDQRRLAYEQAQQDAARARAALARYDASDIAAQADVALAQANIDAARAERERARADVDKSLIKAPARGSVLTLHARPGERPGALGLLTFGDLDDMTADIEIYENEATAIAPGSIVALVADALPRPLAGTVRRVGVEVLRQTLTDASPAANTDTRVIRVSVDLDAASAAIAARFANLQVTARFPRTAPR